MIWTYKAADNTGKFVEGLIEAKNENDVISFLRSKNLLPVRIKEQRQKSSQEFMTLFKGHTDTDLILFTRQLSSMLTSGLTLMQALVILKEQMQKNYIKQIVNGIISQIEEGKTFGEALTAYPTVFSPIYISLIKAGESSGFLDKILIRLADNLEKQQNLKNKVKAALMYPIIVVIMMIGMMILMVIFVIPQLNNFYKNLNIQLPLTTQIMLGISDFILNFWYIAIAGIVVAVFLYRRWIATEHGSLLKDEFILKVPIFGKLIQQSILAEVARTLGLLIGAGSLIVQSLNETADVAGNKVYKTAILEISQRVEKGISIGDAMSFYTLFPPILVQMVKIGEQTGKLDESLLKVSEYFERETEGIVKTLTTAMEPLIMVVLGVGVTFLIISIITPIYNLTTSIH